MQRQNTHPNKQNTVGGNHEAPNYLWELYHGGWAAPNVYFLGYAGAVRFAGLRIAGLSGIYSAAHYKMGHFEAPPYSPSAMRSAYHVREADVYRLMQVHGWLGGGVTVE
jgi:lariat debranching enzyme